MVNTYIIKHYTNAIVFRPGVTIGLIRWRSEKQMKSKLKYHLVFRSGALQFRRKGKTRGGGILFCFKSFVNAEKFVKVENGLK